MGVVMACAPRTVVKSGDQGAGGSFSPKAAGAARRLFSPLRRESGDFAAPVIINHPTAPVAFSFQAALHADGVPVGQPAPEEVRRNGEQDADHRPSKVCSGFHSFASKLRPR
jgi:hypothetical protein